MSRIQIRIQRDPFGQTECEAVRIRIWFRNSARNRYACVFQAEALRSQFELVEDDGGSGAGNSSGKPAQTRLPLTLSHSMLLEEALEAQQPPSKLNLLNANIFVHLELKFKELQKVGSLCQDPGSKHSFLKFNMNIN